MAWRNRIADCTVPYPVRTPSARVSASLAGLLALCCAAVGAAPITVPADGSLTVDGVEYQLLSDAPDYSGLMWEDDGAGGHKACICRMLSFRALQALGDYLGIDNLQVDETTVVAAWNTHGAEEIFVDAMGWTEGAGFSYAVPITPSADLTLADAWHDFTIAGYGSYRISAEASNYAFTDDPSHSDYAAGARSGWTFFDYRTYATTTPGMDATKRYFRDHVREQMVQSFSGTTRFDIAQVPLPGALMLLLTGLAGMGLVRTAGVLRRGH